MKKINLPFYKQTESENCGSAAISMVIEFFGITLDQSDITKIIQKKHNSTGVKNSYVQDMCGYVKDLGLSPLYVGGLSNDLCWKIIKTYIRKEIPIIALQRYSSRLARSHFRVIIGYDFEEETNQYRLFYNDPIDGKDRSMMKDDFFNLWCHKGSHQIRPNELIVIQNKSILIPENKCNFCSSEAITSKTLDLPHTPNYCSYVYPTSNIKSTCMQLDCGTCGIRYIITK